MLFWVENDPQFWLEVEENPQKCEKWERVEEFPPSQIYARCIATPLPEMGLFDLSIGRVQRLKLGGSTDKHLTGAFDRSSSSFFFGVSPISDVPKSQRGMPPIPHATGMAFVGVHHVKWGRLIESRLPSMVVVEFSSENF